MTTLHTMTVQVTLTVDDYNEFFETIPEDCVHYAIERWLEAAPTDLGQGIDAVATTVVDAYVDAEGITHFRQGI